MATVLEHTERRLDALRSRVRLAVCIDAASVLAFRLVVFVVASYAIDRSLQLERPYRTVLLAIALLVISRGIWSRGVRPFVIALSRDELALAFERRNRLDERLISAVQFARHLGGGPSSNPSRMISEPMVREVLAAAEADASQLHASSAIDRVAERDSILRGLGAVLALGLFVTALGSDRSIWFRRNVLLAAVAWPTETRLQFLGVPEGGLAIGPGESLRLSIGVEGVEPDEVEVKFEFEDGHETTARADRVQDGEFRFVAERFAESATLRAVGGDGESDPVRVRVLPYPRLLDLDWTAELPDYLRAGEGRESGRGDESPTRPDRQPGRDLADEARSPRALEVVRGGRARLTVTADKPLTELVLADANSRYRNVADPATETLTLELSPEHDHRFDLSLVDIDGIGLAEIPAFAVRVLEDQPPTLSFEPLGVGTMVTANARIPGRLTASDDYGLRTLAAECVRRRPSDLSDGSRPDEDSSDAPIDLSTAPDPALFGLVPEVADLAELELPISLDLERLPQDTVRPGDRLRIRFSATDARPDQDDGRGFSELRVFRVVTREELLEDLERRQSEVRRDLDEVLSDMVSLLAVVRSDADLQPRRAAPALFAERLTSAADRFASVLDELSNNRLLEARDVDRLRSGVVTALRGTVRGPLERATAELTSSGLDIRQPEESIDRSALGTEIARAADEVRRVLDELDRAEGLPRLVELLRGLLDTTGRVEAEIDRARSSQAVDDIFGPGGGTSGENGGRDRDD